MVREAAVAACLLIGTAQLLAGQGLGSIAGTVRDSAGAPLAGAEVTLETQRAVTTPQGSFRLDSLPVGNHLITIRLVGFVVLRSPVAVRAGVSRYNFVLLPAAHLLPTVYTEAQRAGIYGTVGDTSLTPLNGVRVQLAGRGGGDAVTDSHGRFAFPSAIEGPYVVRAVHPGFAEERLFLELRKGEGKELAIRLGPSSEIATRADEVAVHELGRRLVANLSNDRLSATQLERYGSLGLCDIARIAAKLRERPESVTIILNGTFILEGRSARDLCAWQASEVELIEFGDDICRDVTRTLVDMLGVWCIGFVKPPDAPSSLRLAKGRRIGTQRQPGPFVVIWERR